MFDAHSVEIGHAALAEVEHAAAERLCAHVEQSHGHQVCARPGFEHDWPGEAFLDEAAGPRPALKKRSLGALLEFRPGLTDPVEISYGLKADLEHAIPLAPIP